VSYIIECPECSTRYKLNKPIPEGGRHVKCARCAHQWLLVPDTAADEPLELDDTAQDQPDQQAPQGEASPQTSEHHDVFSRRTAEDERQGDDAAERREDRFAAPQGVDEDDTPQAGFGAFARHGFGGAFDPSDAHAERAPDETAEEQAAVHSGDDQDEQFGDEGPADEPQYPVDDDAATLAPSWQARQDRYAAAISTLSQPDLDAYQNEPASHSADEDERPSSDVAAPVFGEAERPARWTGLDDLSQDDTGDERYASSTTDQEDTAAFGSYPPLSQHSEDAEPDTAENEESSSWASRFMRFRRPRGEARPAAEETESADAEAEDEIRQALNAALEQSDQDERTQAEQDETPHQGFDPRLMPRSGKAETPGQEEAEEDDDDDDEVRMARFPMGFNTDGDNKPQRFQDDLTSLSYDHMSRQDEPDETEDDDPPFRLSGENARTPVYGRGRDETSRPEADDDRFASDSFEEDFETAFGSEGDAAGSRQRRSDKAETGRFDDDDFSSLYDQHFTQDGEGPHGSSEALEDDLAALQSELSGTHVANYESESSGGLAVVAAWAVFISVLSGIVLGLVTFRQEIMTALPGTTSLYRTLGFQIERTGVDFADVSYRWTTSDGRPMIEVRGQVVNVTGETVRVPPVLVNVRNAGGSDTVQATASVQTKELAPRQSASFSLEFLSPPEDVALIELEFDRIR